MYHAYGSGRQSSHSQSPILHVCKCFVCILGTCIYVRLSKLFALFRRSVNHIWQVLLYARRAFYKIDTKDPSNPDAAVVYVLACLGSHKLIYRGNLFFVAKKETINELMYYEMLQVNLLSGGNSSI